MTVQRLGIFIAGALTALAAVLGFSMSQRWFVAHDDAAAKATARPTFTARATVTASPIRVAVPRGYRLAGVAVNADVLYAVIETPDGRHALFRQDEEISGLGRLLHVGAERAVIATPDGDVTLWVAPAPTPTFTSTSRMLTRTVRPAARATLRHAVSTPAATP